MSAPPIDEHSTSRSAPLHRVVSCTRPAVALLGEAGIGKSWMLAEVAERFAPAAYSVRCAPPAGALPARAEALAYAALAAAATPANAERLVAATALNPDRFARALNGFESAKVLATREALGAALAEFETIGSHEQARRVRDAAAALRIPVEERIGRRRRLTEREAELARLVASGKTNAEIAGLLGLSTKTVGHHLSNILSKCGVRSRVDVAALVIRGKLPVHVS